MTRSDGTRLTRQVYPANGHNGVNAPDLLFGLGDHNPTTLPVLITWRDGCGRQHSASTTFAPGWHDMILEPDGTTKGTP